MPVTVKNISLWRKEVENQVGTLAHTLAPVTKAGANLHVLMGYRYPGDGTKAAIELYPVAGKKVTAAASEAGLSASSIPTLLVEGDDRAGLGLAIAKRLVELTGGEIRRGVRAGERSAIPFHGTAGALSRGSE